MAEWMTPGRSLGRHTGGQIGSGKMLDLACVHAWKTPISVFPTRAYQNNPDKLHDIDTHAATITSVSKRHGASRSNSNPLHQAPAAVALARRCPPAPPAHPERPCPPAPAATPDAASTANAALMFPSTLSPERCGRSSARRSRAVTFAAALAGAVVAAVVASGS